MAAPDSRFFVLVVDFLIVCFFYAFVFVGGKNLKLTKKFLIFTKTFLFPPSFLLTERQMGRQGRWWVLESARPSGVTGGRRVTSFLLFFT